MTNPEDNSNQTASTLIKTIIPAVALSILGIGSFLFIYFILGQSFNPFPRLIISLCAPPAIIAILIGFYMLFGSKRNKDG